MEVILKKIIQLLVITMTLISIYSINNHTHADSILKIGVQTSITNHNSSEFDKQLAKQIGKKLKRKIQIKEYSHQSQLKEAVANHQLDMAMGMSTSHLKNLYQTQPYLYIKNVTIGLKPYSLEDLQNKKVGILNESGQYSMLKQLQLYPKQFSNSDQLVNALDQGKVKAIVLNQYQYNLFLNQHPEREKAAQINNSSLKSPLFKKIDNPQILSQQLFAITNDHTLAKQVSHAINALRMNGELTKLSAKYYQYNYAFK